MARPWPGLLLYPAKRAILVIRSSSEKQQQCTEQAKNSLLYVYNFVSISSLIFLTGIAGNLKSEHYKSIGDNPLLLPPLHDTLIDLVNDASCPPSEADFPSFSQPSEVTEEMSESLSTD